MMDLTSPIHDNQISRRDFLLINFDSYHFHLMNSEQRCTAMMVFWSGNGNFVDYPTRFRQVAIYQQQLASSGMWSKLVSKFKKEYCYVTLSVKGKGRVVVHGAVNYGASFSCALPGLVQMTNVRPKLKNFNFLGLFFFKASLIDFSR